MGGGGEKSPEKAEVEQPGGGGYWRDESRGEGSARRVDNLDDGADMQPHSEGATCHRGGYAAVATTVRN